VRVIPRGLVVLSVPRSHSSRCCHGMSMVTLLPNVITEILDVLDAPTVPFAKLLLSNGTSKLIINCTVAFQALSYDVMIDNDRSSTMATSTGKSHASTVGELVGEEVGEEVSVGSGAGAVVVGADETGEPVGVDMVGAPVGASVGGRVSQQVAGHSSLTSASLSHK